MMEVILSVGLTAALLGLFSAMVVQYGAIRREQDIRRVLRLAAVDELQRLRAGLVSVGDSPAEPDEAALESGEIVVTTRASSGHGDWAGLTRVEVTARKRVSAQRCVEVTLIACLDVGGSPP